MKKLLMPLLGVLFGSVPSLYSQPILTPSQVVAAAAAVSQTQPLPADSIGPIGLFYSALNPANPPVPCNFSDLPAWDLGNGIYLLDDVDPAPPFSMRAMDDSGPPSPGDGGGGSGGGGSTNTYSYTFDTNGLWLAISSITNGIISVNLNNATNQVYEVWSAESLTNASWNIEQEVWPTNQSCMPFSVDLGDRTNALFFYARDWTGVTENGNTTPDWWFYYWFGAIGFADTNWDSVGVPFLDDYQNGLDPNVISFYPSVTNQYANVSDVPVQLNVTTGWPSYLAVMVDDTNFAADASWVPYPGSNITVNLGSMEGWHQVWIGLRGFPTNATAIWRSLSLNLDLSPPVLTITNPSNSVTAQPVLELQGGSDRPIAQVNYDLQNDAGYFTNLPGVVTGQTIDAASGHFAANSFQCYDIPLTNGLNTVTLRVTDRAGNLATTNIQLTLDYAGATNPPAISVYWPQDGDSVAGTNITLRGSLDDFTASLTAQIVDTNGDTNDLSGLVERNGLYWVENVPLAIGPNYITLTATDAAGNISSTNITVTNLGSVITINDYSGALGGNPPNIIPTVSGTIGLTDCTLWVNGVEATQNGDGTWQANAVPVSGGGTAVVEARAIPNTDNGGNGTQTAAPTDGTPINPTASDSVSGQEQIDQPSFSYVEDFSQSRVTTGQYNTRCDECPAVGIFSESWSANGGTYTGGSAQVGESDNGADCVGPYTLGDDWSYSWPCDGCPGVFVETGDGILITSNNQPSPGSWIGSFGFFGSGGMEQLSWSQEQSVILDEQNCPEGDPSVETDTGNGCSSVTLRTGGKGVAGKQNLFGLSATATEYDIGSLSAEDDYASFLWTEQEVDPSQIKIMGQSQQNGAVYKVLQDNSTCDITPQAPPQCYTYSVGATKYPASFQVFVCQPYPALTYFGEPYLAPPVGFPIWAPGVNAGHAWWQLSCAAPAVAMNQFTSSNNFQWLNQQVGYGPASSIFWTTPWSVGSAPGEFPFPNTDIATAARSYTIGFYNLIGGLAYTENRYTTQGIYQIPGNDCVSTTRSAGAAAGVALPNDATPEFFGAHLPPSH